MAEVTNPIAKKYSGTHSQRRLLQQQEGNKYDVQNAHIIVIATCSNTFVYVYNILTWT